MSASIYFSNFAVFHLFFKQRGGGAFKMSDCIFEKMQENEKTIVKL